MTTAPIITVTDTVEDGTVVRWFVSLADAEAFRPVCDASRHHVRCAPGCPPELAQAAMDVLEQLRTDPYANLKPLATHARRTYYGPMEPIER